MQLIDIDALTFWFTKHGRSLPWRENFSPYAVWISEVMLQQTQVSVVIPYFQRFIRSFPSITALAQASEEEVLKSWEGLGYYARARRLHQGARYLVTHNGGVLPPDRLALSKVKGLGPYTIGAILSFAFKQKAVALDGNVMRVLCRFWDIEDPIDQVSTKKKLEAALFKALPEKEPFVAMEALIELGALICQRTPRCSSCPLKRSCLANKRGRALLLPKKKKEKAIATLRRLVPVISTHSELLLRREEEGKVMGGLWEFPYLALDQKGVKDPLVAEHFSLPLTYLGTLPSLSHTFTRFRATLYPKMWFSSQKLPCKGYQWIRFDQLEQKPFSSGHRRVLLSFLNFKKKDVK